MSKDDDFKLKVKSSYYFFTKKDYKRSLKELERAAKMIAKEMSKGRQ